KAQWPPCSISEDAGHECVCCSAVRDAVTEPWTKQHCGPVVLAMGCVDISNLPGHGRPANPGKNRSVQRDQQLSSYESVDNNYEQYMRSADRRAVAKCGFDGNESRCADLVEVFVLMEIRGQTHRSPNFGVRQVKLIKQAPDTKLGERCV